MKRSGRQTISIDSTLMAPPAMAALLHAPRMVGQQVVMALCAAAQAKWQILAKQELKTTAGAYENAIQEPVIEGHVGRIMLEGTLPNLVEQGQAAYDMRWTLCWNPMAKNRKPIKDKHGATIGWYNIIPLRHGTPGTSGVNFPAMMDPYGPSRPMSRAATHTEIAPGQRHAQAQALYQVAKRLQATIGKAWGGTLWGERLSESTLKDLGIPKLREHHKSSIYAGMVKQQSAYESAIQSQYTTFRMISTRMKSGWLHPGITARMLHLKVAEYLGTIGGAVWDQVTGGQA